MNISIVGTGYVGLVSGACLADFGHDIVCGDIDAERIARLESGVVPFYGPELSEIVARNRARGRLEFTTSIERAVEHGLVIFIAVGTPESPCADALVVLTEWNEFRGIDLTAVRGVMRGHVLVDGRNVLDPESAVAAGFSYSGIGRRPSITRQVAVS